MFKQKNNFNNNNVEERPHTSLAGATGQGDPVKTSFACPRGKERERESKGHFLKIPPLLKGARGILNSIKKRLPNTLKITLTSLIAAFACTGIIYAATTVGNNITTGGTLDVTGAATFTTASSTGIVKFAQINSDTGAISFGNENLTTTGTLTVSGLTTLGSASTTLLSVSGNTYITGILNVTSLTTLGNASTTALSVSGNLTVGDGTPDVTLDGEDVYIEGTLEVDGSMRVDSGSLQRDAKYIVFESSGTVYVVDGKTGETLNSNATDHTAIQWAIDNLTNGRSNKEKIILVGSFTLTDKIQLDDYTILDLTNAILSVDGASWSTDGSDVEIISVNDYINGVDHIEIIGGKITWTFVEDVVESEDAGADTFTMTGHPFSNGERVFYYPDPDDDCGLDGPPDANTDNYYICNSTNDTVQLDTDDTACDTLFNVTACTPDGTFKHDPTYGIDGIGIRSKGIESNSGTMTMPTPSCIGTCGNNVTVETTHASCAGSTCRWQGYKETIYEVKIAAEGTPDTFNWRAKYNDCPYGDSCWSEWSTTTSNAEQAAGGVELTHTDTNLIEFSNNLHIIWDDEAGSTAGDVWTVTVPYAEDIKISGVILKGFRSHGVSLIGVTDFIVENNNISGMGDDGVSTTQHTSYGSILNNTVNDNDSRKGGSSAVEIEDGSAFISISGTTSKDLGVSVILDSGTTSYLAPKQVSIQKNNIYRINLQGNATYSLSGMTVSTNTIRGDRNLGNVNGITASYMDWSSISSNTVSDSSGYGISMTQAGNYNTISNNTIRRCDTDTYDNSTYGIYLNGDFNSVTGNTIDDDGATSRCRGILINSGSTYNTVTGNVFGRLRTSTSDLSYIKNNGTSNTIFGNANDSWLNSTGGNLTPQNDSLTIPANGVTRMRVWSTVTTGTLADGQFAGQIKTVVGEGTEPSGAILTLPKWSDDDRTDSDALDTCVFSNDGESITVLWDDTIWRTLYKSCVWTDN